MSEFLLYQDVLETIIKDGGKLKISGTTYNVWKTTDHPMVDNGEKFACTKSFEYQCPKCLKKTNLRTCSCYEPLGEGSSQVDF